MARRQSSFFLIIDFDDDEIAPDFMADPARVAALLNSVIRRIIPFSLWRVSDLHTMN